MDNERREAGRLMDLNGAIVLITGAGGEIGQAATKAFVEAGVAKVYAATRVANAEVGLTHEHVVPIHLDVTDKASIDAAAAKCTDVTVLVNNAGVNHNAPAIGAADDEWARHEIEVNYLGNLAVSRAFAPILIANGGGAMVNVLSILSRVNHPGMATYCASKAALYSVTQAFRAQLRPHGTFVCSFMPGAVATRLTAHLAIPKMSTVDAAVAMIDALRNDVEDAYPGDMAGGVSAGLAHDHKAVESQFAEFI
jgi:NAD(P)-dependent dehydrogenase (short-subunit alcohol dehydrogenase family)